MTNFRGERKRLFFGQRLVVDRGTIKVMVQRLPQYVVDDDDPRAPPHDVWVAMTERERRIQLEALPSEFPVSEAAPPEGDPHFGAVVEAREVLRSHFGRTGGRVYIGNDLPVYYPGARMFAPDVIAVRDVETHEREHWTVSAEGKGLDLALEILWSGRRTKDLRDNVVRYAKLGILEYFVFDKRKRALQGYRLPGKSARAYERIVPQGGCYASRVLGLDLSLEGDRLRFLSGLAPLPNAAERAARLDALLDAMTEDRDAEAKRAEEEAERAEEEAKRAEEEAKRAEEEAKRADAAEQRLVEALTEVERLKRV